jgi:Ni,Fe-hydrogenase III small subunit/formate hydrogenlyase subunit 6/NADH:ubiquinone oxidoreductase subunit I
MLRFFRALMEQGRPTSSFPGEVPSFPERFRGRPSLDATKCTGGCRACMEAMPSSLLAEGRDGLVKLDLGACLFAPEEAAACPEGAIRFSQDWRLAARDRDELTTPNGEIRLAQSLEAEMRRLFGRSLRLRSVAAGSCNGCEAELVALGNVVFDMARFGVQFVASPRHADGIVLTGAVSRNMRSAVYETYEAVPAPRLVIAVGACAINGGPFRGSPEVEDGVPVDLPVDLWIPGCPPHPITILDGLLRLLGRMEEAR